GGATAGMVLPRPYFTLPDGRVKKIRRENDRGRGFPVAPCRGSGCRLHCCRSARAEAPHGAIQQRHHRADQGRVSELFPGPLVFPPGPAPTAGGEKNAPPLTERSLP